MGRLLTSSGLPLPRGTPPHSLQKGATDPGSHKQLIAENVLIFAPLLGGWVQGPLGCCCVRGTWVLWCCAEQSHSEAPVPKPPPQSPSAHTWLVGVGSAAIPRLVVDEEGAAEGHQAPAQAGRQRGERSHGQQLSPAHPSPVPPGLARKESTRLQARVIRRATQPLAPWGQGC